MCSGQCGAGKPGVDSALVVHHARRRPTVVERLDVEPGVVLTWLRDGLRRVRRLSAEEVPAEPLVGALLAARDRLSRTQQKLDSLDALETPLGPYGAATVIEAVLAKALMEREVVLARPEQLHRRAGHRHRVSGDSAPAPWTRS